MKKPKLTNTAVCVFIIVVATIYFLFSGETKETVSQPDEEVIAILQNAGYKNPTLGMVVRNMPDGAFGPCILFTADSYKGEQVSGSYCTPKFLDWKIRIITSGSK